MSKKYLLRELSRETILNSFDLLHEKKVKKYEILENGNYLFRDVLLQEADKINGNERIYPYKILKDVVDLYIEKKINYKQAVGALGHPSTAEIDPSRISHHIDKIWWSGKQVRGDVRILSTTTHGREAIGLIESDITLGISSRSVGSVTKKTNHNEVNEDLELVCWDLVIEPSTENAYLNESKLIEVNEFNKLPSNTELYRKFDQLLKIRGK